MPSSTDASESPRRARAARARRRDEEALEAREAFRDALRVVVRRRWLIGAVLCLVVGLVALYTYTRTPIYRATSRVLIERDTPQGPFQDVYEQPGRGDDFYETQYRLMRSGRIARSVFQEMGLERTRRYRDARDPLEAFTEDIHVEPIRGSRLVDLGFDHPDPAISRRVVNALVDSYKEDNTARRRTTSTALMAHLTEEVHRLEPQLRDVAERLAAFRVEHQLFDAEKQEEMLTHRLEALSDAHSTAQVEAVKARAEHDLVQQYEETHGYVFDPMTVRGDWAYANLLRDFAQARADLSQAADVYAESHPVRRAAQLEMEAVEEILRDYQSQVMESYRLRANAFEDRAERLGELLEEQREEILGLQETDLDHRLLQDEDERLRELYNTLLQRIREIDVTASPTGGASNIFVIDPARRPHAPAWPRKRLNLILAALCGLALGIGAAFLAEFLDETLKAKEDIETALDLTVVGAVPRISAEPAATATLLEPSSAGAEAFRTIRTAISLSSSAGFENRVLLVTSADPGDGKSITATNLAISFATGGERVLLIDADLRKPWNAAAGEVLGIEPGTRGLAGALTESGTPDDFLGAVQGSAIENLDLLPSGDIPEQPNELLTRAPFRSFVEEARESYDRVIIDVPPILAFADAAALSTHADGVLFVVRSEKTLRRHAELALDQLRQVEARIIGVVANHVDAPKTTRYGSYGYGYGYGYRYGQRGERPGPDERRREGPRGPDRGSSGDAE